MLMIPARWAVSLVVMLLSSVTANSQTQPSSSSASQTATGNWPTASPAEGGGLSDARLRSLDAAIRSGEFKKIGGVLIARHGKLVYASYFDGDAATLHNTRSATKSTTDVLIGIAIDEHKLSGVDAKILALLPDAVAGCRIPGDHDMSPRPYRSACVGTAASAVQAVRSTAVSAETATARSASPHPRA